MIAAGTARATTIYDRIDLERTTTSGIDVRGFVDPCWGIYVAMFGSAGLAATAAAGWLATSVTSSTKVSPTAA